MFNQRLDQHRDEQQLPPRTERAIVDQRDRLAALTVPGDLAPDRAAVERAVEDSFVAGYRLVMLVGAGMAMAGAVIAWRMIPARSGAEVRCDERSTMDG